MMKFSMNERNYEYAKDSGVVRFKDRYLVYYSMPYFPESESRRINGWGIGVAESTDLVNWNDLGELPLPSHLVVGEGCASATWSHNDKIYMFYGESYNKHFRKIGCAVSSDGIHFERISNELYPEEWNCAESGHPYTFTDDDGREYLFFQGNNDKGKTRCFACKEIIWQGDMPIFKDVEMKMGIDTLCRCLLLEPEALECIRQYWDSNAVQEELPRFLTFAFWVEYREKLNLTPDELIRMDALVKKVCDCATENPVFCAFFNRVHRLLFVEKLDFPSEQLPELETLLGDASGIPALLLSLSALPLVAKKYASMGIPEKYHEGPLGWIAGTIRHYQAGKRGRLGQFLSQTYWLRYSVRGELFRIGRFEFQVCPGYSWHLPFFRNEAGEYLLFADPAWYIDAQGYKVNEPGEGIWQPIFSDLDGSLRGYPIDTAAGTVQKKLVDVDSTLWKPVLAPHSFCVHLHIPGGGGMTPEIADASFREAVQFFRTYFHREIAAFLCTSWILNPAWQRLLPGSNLDKMQKKLLLYPAGADPYSGLFFVFGRSDDDFASYPADTTLRRVFHQVWAEGDTLRPGSMILPAEQYRPFTQTSR
ncbi:MAG: hypothetical protein J6C40_10295 [Lentisphaeria bacterium]|nr:hypothetical protein [Lentisphaeria bacterium]